MKRFFNFALVLLTAAGLASCQRFEDEAILPDAYSVIVNTAETRTANEGYDTVWSSGDEMTMFWKSESGTPHSGKFSYTSGNKFTTTKDVGSSDYRWYGVYPYSDSNTSYTEVSASIPASQTQDGNGSMAHLAGSGFPLWGRTDGYVPNGDTPVFTAHQVATVLKYVVTNTDETPVTVTKIQFSAPKAIAGACKADLTSENVVWQPSSSNTSQAVTLNVTNGSTIKNGESASFFVGAIPFSETGEYTVNVYATDGENNFVYTNKVNGKFVAESGKINTIPLSFVPGDPVAGVTGYELVTSEPSDWSGSYLIVDVSKAKVFTGKTDQSNYYTLKSSDIEGNVITNSSLSQYVFTITKNGNNFYLKQGDNYYSVNWTSNSSTGIVTSTSQTAISYGGVLSNGAFLFYGVDSSVNKYLYVKSGEAYFKFGESGGKTGILLYKYTEGATPIDPPTPSTDKTYKKVTSFESGKNYVIVYDGHALQNNSGSPAAYSVTASGSTITVPASVASSIEWTANSESAYTISGHFSLSNNGKYAARTDDSQNGFEFQTSAVQKAVWDLDADGNDLYHKNSNGQYTFYLTYSSNKWSVSSQNSSNKIAVYAEDDSQPEKQTQTLSFANSAVEWTLGDTYKVGSSYDAQSVSDAKTTVTLTSSNEDVATISDGKIKIVGAGTTNIIATAAEDDTYYGDSASYTLTIKPAPAPITEKCYVKVTSAPQDWSGTYIIVDESAKKAFDENASSYASTVGISDGKIAWSETVAKYEIKVSPSSVSGMYELKTVNGKYMYSYNYGETTLNSSNKDNRSRIYYNSLSISGGNVTMFSTRGEDGSVNYFGYVSNTSENPNKKNFGYKEDATSRTVQFYKLSEGGDEPATKQDQTISFANSSVEWTLGDTYKVNGTYEAQSVNDAHTTVTLSSSNTAVATISDGKIKIVGTGETTITATAAEDATYKSATATYKLTIKPAATPSSEKTYKKVTSITEGTYIICGSEDAGTYVCLFPPVDATYSNKDKKFDTTNKCNHSLFSSSNTITEIKTSDTSIIGSEVEITASGSSWLIKLKSNGLYMYYNNNKIDFTSTSSSAAQTIGRFSSGKSSMKQGNQLFYHSGTNEGFGYKNRSDVSNLMFFKLDEGSTPDTPDTPAQSSLNIENKQLAAYLDAVEKQPYFSNNTFGSYDSNYTSSLMKSNMYYSGSSSSNRLDQPVPVVITWSGNATKIEVFTSSSKTSASRVASETFSSSSSASIYNLIPGQKYYYTATNGTTTVATGDFTPEGRRRMIRVSSSFDARYAANCRDFGGLPTVDGKHVKYGLIYRGSNIDGLSSDNDAKDVFLNTMKIKWDIDLRASNEKGSAPTLSGVSKGTQSYSASFDNDNLRSKTKVAKTLKEIIDAINKDTPEPVYIHCKIGSDRTGYICLLVEALIGVTQNYCDTDYEITSFTGNVTGTRFRVDNTMGGGMYKSGIQYFENYSGTTLHDKVYNFVTSSDGLNISEDDVDKFISRMKE